MKNKDEVELKLEPIIVPLEVAKAIELLREQKLSDMDIIVGVRTCTFWNNVKIHNALRVISRWLTADDEKEDILIRALANGYETNLTPAEELQQYYKKIKC